TTQNRTLSHFVVKFTSLYSHHSTSKKLLTSFLKMRVAKELGGPIYASMLVDCCCQQRTYERFYGLLCERFCRLRKEYQVPFLIEIHVTSMTFEKIACDTYATIHRFDITKLRNMARLISHLLFTDAISWTIFSDVKLTENDTTSSGRIYLKYVFQELCESMGLTKLYERVTDPTLQQAFAGLFPRDNPQNTRFAINFFTLTGLGGLTSTDFFLPTPPLTPHSLSRLDLRQFLEKGMKKKKEESVEESASSSSSSDTSGDSSDSDSDSDGDDDSDSSSSSSSSSSSDSDSAKKPKAAKDSVKRRLKESKEPKGSDKQIKEEPLSPRNDRRNGREEERMDSSYARRKQEDRRRSRSGSRTRKDAKSPARRHEKQHSDRTSSTAAKESSRSRSERKDDSLRRKSPPRSSRNNEDDRSNENTPPSKTRDAGRSRRERRKGSSSSRSSSREKKRKSKNSSNHKERERSPEVRLRELRVGDRDRRDRS
ncbi:hypothetical protein OSTOST_13627, partial [Ostertagia ostertagi]